MDAAKAATRQSIIKPDGVTVLFAAGVKTDG